MLILPGNEPVLSPISVNNIHVFVTFLLKDIGYIIVAQCQCHQGKSSDATDRTKRTKRVYKMKAAMFIAILLAAVCVVFTYVPPVQRPRPGYTIPTFPGHGPFNPKVQWPYPVPNIRH